MATHSHLKQGNQKILETMEMLTTWSLGLCQVLIESVCSILRSRRPRTMGAGIGHLSPCTRCPGQQDHSWSAASISYPLISLIHRNSSDSALNAINIWASTALHGTPFKILALFPYKYVPGAWCRLVEMTWPYYVTQCLLIPNSSAIWNILQISTLFETSYESSVF